MNKKRCKLEDYVNDSKVNGTIELYLGNKIVQGDHNGKKYYDISLVKEIFGVRKNGVEIGDIFSISDFSNFQKLHRPNYFPGANLNGHNDSSGIVASYKNLKLFTPLDPNTYYVTHLRPLWQYGRFDDMKDIKDFVTKYNEKNLSRIVRKIDKDGLQIHDWWYCGGELMSEEDYVEIVSTTPENLSATLGVVYDGGYSASRCLKKIRR